MILEVEECNFIPNWRYNCISIRSEDQVPSSVHRPKQVGKFVRKFHFDFTKVSSEGTKHHQIKIIVFVSI